jgi:hypothetical protein
MDLIMKSGWVRVVVRTIALSNYAITPEGGRFQRHGNRNVWPW